MLQLVAPIGFSAFWVCFQLVAQVNADTVVAIEAEITLSEDSSAIAEWTLTDGVLNGYDQLRLAASSSLEYTVRYSMDGTTRTSPSTSTSRVVVATLPRSTRRVYFARRISIGGAAFLKPTMTS